MSRTNLEFLFQVVGPIGERSVGAATRGDGERPAFGDHLSQASATTSSDIGNCALRNDSIRERGGERPPESNSSPCGSDSKSADGYCDETPVDRPDENEVASDGAEAVGIDDTGETNTADRGVADDEQDSDEEDTVQIAAEAVASVDGKLNHTAEIAEATKTLRDGTTVGERAQHGQPSAQKANTTSPHEDEAAKEQRLVAAANLQNSIDPSTQSSEAANAIVELPDQPAATKAVRKSRTASTTADDESQTADKAAAVKRAAANEIGSDVALRDAATSTKESSTADSTRNELSQPSDAASGLDDSKRDSTSRDATRQRGDAEAVANKIAATAIVNGVVPQTRDGVASAEVAESRAQGAKAVGAKTDAVATATSRLHTNHNAAARAGKTNGQDDTPHVDPARFVGRVAKAFHSAQERGGTLQLRLSPPELGAMRIELSVKDGVMTAALETETATARRVLLEHLPALRDRLAEQNIRVERFDVDVRREGSGGQADPRAPQDREPPQQGQPNRRQQTTQQRIGSAQRPSAPLSLPLTDTPGINLVA